MPITYNIFKKFCGNTKVYVETGTDKGVSLNLALTNGFETLYTIDILDCEDVRQRYAYRSNIKFIKGDSASELKNVLKEIVSPATIYLDAHICGDESNNLPIFGELAAINEHPIKNHIIILDDVRLFKDVMRINVDDVKNCISSINKDYKFSFEPDGIHKHDVLVAYV